jgi:putative hemolysin
MVELLIIFLLIMLNGLFAMSEIAMVSSRKSRLEAFAKRGDATAKKALWLQQHPSRFLSTVQIGITLIGIFTGIYSGEKIEADLERFLERYEIFREHSKTIAIAAIVVVLTFFSLVLGELVPKRIALTTPERISKAVAYPMYWISVAASPFIWLLTVCTELLLKLLRVKKHADRKMSDDELRFIINEARETGALQEIEHDIVDNVIHLGDRTIRTLFTPRDEVTWLNSQLPADQLRKIIISSKHKSFPIGNGSLNQITGIVYAKDLLNSLLMRQELDFQKLSRPVLYLPEHTTAFSALEQLRNSGQHLALVVNRQGIVLGLLTKNDLIDQLVGDYAEHLHREEEIIPRGDGSFLVDTSVPFPEFLRYFSIHTEDGEIPAHVYTVLDWLPDAAKDSLQTGSKFTWKDLQVEIIDLDGDRVDKLLVTRVGVTED